MYMGSIILDLTHCLLASSHELGKWDMCTLLAFIEESTGGLLPSLVCLKLVETMLHVQYKL